MLNAVSMLLSFPSLSLSYSSLRRLHHLHRSDTPSLLLLKGTSRPCSILYNRKCSSISSKREGWLTLTWAPPPLTLGSSTSSRRAFSSTIGCSFASFFSPAAAVSPLSSCSSSSFLISDLIFDCCAYHQLLSLVRSSSFPSTLMRRDPVISLCAFSRSYICSHSEESSFANFLPFTDKSNPSPSIIFALIPASSEGFPVRGSTKSPSGLRPRRSSATVRWVHFRRSAFASSSAMMSHDPLLSLYSLRRSSMSSQPWLGVVAALAPSFPFSPRMDRSYPIASSRRAFSAMARDGFPVLRSMKFPSGVHPDRRSDKARPSHLRRSAYGPSPRGISNDPAPSLNNLSLSSMTNHSSLG
mmetsp:Transcript_29914/g.88930  ORF Transcript_29914/g.88930 Transcript_29914/m.88930 type:complete len:355 (-) Transcript_29914:605-1669(-)